MKTLILLRHAKSSWKDNTLTDIDRPLSKRGKREAALMGQRIRQHGCIPELILSSPAKRARKTARLVAKELDYAKESIQIHPAIYLQDIDGIWQAVSEVADQVNQLLLVGHNPDLSHLAERWLKKDNQIGELPTGGMVGLGLPFKTWKDVAKQKKGKLLFYDYPRLHLGQEDNELSPSVEQE